MVKRLIAVAYIALFCTASTPGGAQASIGRTYWTTAQAESNVYNSGWADKHNISEVSCDGASRPKMDAALEPFFYLLTCDASYPSTQYGDAFTCDLTITVRPISPTRFILSGGGNPYCLPDQGWVPGN
jgi:hypothetical protein